MDFSKTVIYHFVCKDEMVKCSYVGSTTNFNKRKGNHKTDCCCETSRHYHLKVYQTIRDNGGWDNWDMKPLEEFACENKIQQVIREQYWIDKLKPEMNCKVAYREGTESEKQKAYYEENQEHIKEYKKEWYESNKEHINERTKLYYNDNYDKIKEYQSMKITCNCGSVFRISDKARHERSKKHLDYKTI